MNINSRILTVSSKHSSTLVNWYFLALLPVFHYIRIWPLLPPSVATRGSNLYHLLHKIITNRYAHLINLILFYNWTVSTFCVGSTCIHRWEGPCWKGRRGMSAGGWSPRRTPLNKKNPKRISARELLRENRRDWWIHVPHSIAGGAVTPKASHWQLQQREQCRR